MLKWWVRRQIAAFERTFDYDASVMHEILDADLAAALKLRGINALGRYARNVPPEALYAAKMAATLSEDCGPCTQLVVTMAERAGVAPAVLRALVARDGAALPPAAGLAFRFAEAAIAHAPAADALRAQVRERWGDQGLITLAYAILVGRTFPMLKYAMGHGQACTRVQVGGTPVPVLRAAS